MVDACQHMHCAVQMTRHIVQSGVHLQRSRFLAVQHFVLHKALGLALGHSEIFGRPHGLCANTLVLYLGAAKRTVLQNCWNLSIADVAAITANAEAKKIDEDRAEANACVCLFAAATSLVILSAFTSLMRSKRHLSARPRLHLPTFVQPPLLNLANR